MSGISSDRWSDIASSHETSEASGIMSVHAMKESSVSRHDDTPGLFNAFCQKLFCWRRCRADAESTDGVWWLCCTGVYPRRSERHRTIVADSKQISVHWLPSAAAGVDTKVHQPAGGAHRHDPKCNCANNTTVNDREGGTSRMCAQNDSLRRFSPQASDSLRRGKQSAAVRRVMLADAAYGHATVLDDCVVSDSDAWSGSLSLSRPNSGSNSLERVVVHENIDEIYESYSDDGDTEVEVNWPAVMPLPALPVYDQVKESSPGWSLASELRRLVHYGWYWGPITRVEAEEKLAGQEDGTFLVRDSSDDHYLLSLSFRSYGRTLHTRIEHCQGSFSLYSQSGSDGYQSIVELIERSVDDSRTGVFCYSRARALGSPSFPVRLTRAVSRFAQVRSLQYLCRFLIRQHTRVDHIQKLPLPISIKGWLEERPY